MTKSRRTLINNRDRIPDFITDDEIIEVKNVKKQALTRQIKDSIDLAKENGKKFVLWTDEKTDLTKPLDALVKKGLIGQNKTPFNKGVK